MRKLVIHHIGPVKHVDLVLKRINVVIGPQSAGKSCILKVACFCAWAEKKGFSWSRGKMALLILNM